MKPGASTRPPPSTTRRPRASPAGMRPIRSMRPSRTSTSALRAGAPLPSTNRTSRSSRPPAGADLHPPSPSGTSAQAPPAATAPRNSRLLQPAMPPPLPVADVLCEERFEAPVELGVVLVLVEPVRLARHGHPLRCVAGPFQRLLHRHGLRVRGAL